MKVVYVYLGIVFGGAAVAYGIYRFQDRGWPGLLGLVGLVLFCLATARRQRKKKLAQEGPARSNADDRTP
jgi:hypothetical protein